MNVKLYSRGDEISNKLKEYIEVKLINQKVSLKDNDLDFIISIGGDGTMLQAIHDNIDQIDKAIFVGIQTGTLGFYADFKKDQVDDLIYKIINDEKKFKNRYLLEFNICRDDVCEIGYALNEITLVNPYHTQVLDICVDEKHFYTMRGTGICLSTSSGSSAYNKSLGGAIVDRNIKCIQLTEMAPLNNSVYRSIGAPVVFNDQRVIKINSKEFEHVTFTYDMYTKELENYNYIECRVSPKKVKFGNYTNIALIERLKKSFL